MNNILLFGMPGGTEWVVIILVVLLLFGAKRLPELAKGLGKSIREYKKRQAKSKTISARPSKKKKLRRWTPRRRNLSRPRLPLRTRTKWNKKLLSYLIF